MTDMRGRIYRSHWSPRLLVEVVDECEVRLGSQRKTPGVLYRRIDSHGESEPLTVRPLQEFLRTFEVRD